MAGGDGSDEATHTVHLYVPISSFHKPHTVTTYGVSTYFLVTLSRGNTTYANTPAFISHSFLSRTQDSETIRSIRIYFTFRNNELSACFGRSKWIGPSMELAVGVAPLGDANQGIVVDYKAMGGAALWKRSIVQVILGLAYVTKWTQEIYILLTTPVVLFTELCRSGWKTPCWQKLTSHSHEFKTACLTIQDTMNECWSSITTWTPYGWAESLRALHEWIIYTLILLWGKLFEENAMPCNLIELLFSVKAFPAKRMLGFHWLTLYLIE